MAKVSVLIPTKDRPQLLPITLTALAFQTFPDFEIIIRDESQAFSSIGGNSSVSQAIDLLATKSGVSVKYLRDVQSRGIAAARKELLSYSKADLIWFVDDDTAPEPQCLEKLVETQLKHDAGFVQGAKINIDNKLNYPDHNYGFIDFNPDIEISIFSRYSQDITVPIVCGDTANLMFKRKYLLDAGGFDFAETMPLDLRCEDWIASVMVADSRKCFFRSSAITWHYSTDSRAEWLAEQHKIAVSYLSQNVSQKTFFAFENQMDLR